MVEAGAKEASEKDMLEALMFGHDAIKELVTFQNKIIEEIGEEKMPYETLKIDDKLIKEINEMVGKKIDKALRIKEKLAKYEAIENVKMK